MADKKSERDDMRAVFDAAKAQVPTPPTALMARVLDDALAQQAKIETAKAVAPRRGAWRDLFRALGGWPAMAGLAAATVAGVWLGVSPPGILPDATGAYLGLSDAAYLIDTGPGLGFDLGGEML